MRAARRAVAHDALRARNSNIAVVAGTCPRLHILDPAHFGPLTVASAVRTPENPPAMIAINVATAAR